MLRRLDTDAQPAHGTGVEQSDLLANRAYETEFVEGRGTETVNDPPDVEDGVGELVLGSSEEWLKADRIVLQGLPSEIQLQAYPGQLRTEAVVEVVANAPPLLLPGQDELFPAPLEIRRQPDGMDGCREPAREVFAEELLLAPKRLRFAPMTKD